MGDISMEEFSDLDVFVLCLLMAGIEPTFCEISENMNNFYLTVSAGEQVRII